MNISYYPEKQFEQIILNAASQIEGLDGVFDAQIKKADPRFGDFQANGCMAAAKILKKNPRALAEELIEKIRALCSEEIALFDIAGPGFINIKLSTKYLDAWLEKYSNSSTDISPDFLKGQKIIIDYPSANTAKQMHVGHLRPMVIGEGVSRLLKFCGCDLVADNHIGDWGTNFGLLIYAIKKENYILQKDNPNALEELEGLYKRASSLSKEDESIADLARAELVKLQNGDKENYELWTLITEVSKSSFEKIYDLLGINIDCTLGESFYRDKVDRIYKELQEIGLAVEDQGALVVFLKDHPRFAKQPFIIRKKDGASNYASTDLATVLYRVEHFGADQIIYVTDGRQQDHFEQLFLTVDKWFAAKGYKKPKLKHVWFGTILGQDGKAIKTKSGEPIRLKELLNEAVEKAKCIVKEKNPTLDEGEALKIATAVGLGAVKYADLSQNRTLDYVFSWDKLLAFDGNTAPYLLYAVARIFSIFRKANVLADANIENVAPLSEDTEIALCKKLAAFCGVIDLTLSELREHNLCTYLFELAGAFSSFYNSCKVIVEDEKVMNKRLLLCQLTLKTLQKGLDLLAIDTLEKM